jgi:hypothetical protein
MSEYHKGIESISSTGLKMLLQQSPMHYHRAYTEERPEPTKAQLFGIAAHVMILEGPEVFQERYAVMPENMDRRTKKGKAAYEEWLQSAGEREAVTTKDFIAMHEMSMSFGKNDEVRSMMFGRKGQAETEILWRDPITGALCKCKPDWLSADTMYAIDLKTCDSAHPEDVSRAIKRYMYHLSAAFYLQGIEAARLRIPMWRWVFVEKKPPYAVAVYSPAPELIDDGDALVSKALDIYRSCSRRSKWDIGYEGCPDIDIYRPRKD